MAMFTGAVKCNPPLTEENVIANYSYPAIEGTNVTLACNDPGLLFNGSNLSTCMENGEWEPDPMEVKCIPKGNVTCTKPCFVKLIPCFLSTINDMYMYFY